MLGVLMPGVREVRAPLVAGSLLLVSAYLLLFDSTRSVLDDDRVSPALESLYGLLGRTGLLVAAAITAYLVGAVVTRLVSRRLHRYQVGMVRRITADSYLSTSAKPRVLAFQAPFTRPSVRRISELCRQRGVPAETVLGEIIKVRGKRLLAANRDLYAEYDRLQSEAEFRLALVLPSMFLSVALALQVPALLAAEIVAVVLLSVVFFFVIGDALAMLREANSLYAHAVVDGMISTPTLDSERDLPPVAEGD